MTAMIEDSKIYEYTLEEKRHQEQRRENMNGYYITLLSTFIAITPFLFNTILAEEMNDESDRVKYFLTLFLIIGISLTTIWHANLKRILYNLEILDGYIIDLETKLKISFNKQIISILQKRHSPERITKYQLLLPKLFASIFLMLIIMQFI